MRLFFLLMILFLSGCTKLSESAPNPDHWTIKGKAVVHKIDKKEKLWFVWTHEGQEDTLTLMDRMGLEAITFCKKGQQAWQNPKYKRIDLEKKLGFALPMEALPHWLQGKKVKAPEGWTLKTLQANHIVLLAPNLEISLHIRHRS